MPSWNSAFPGRVGIYCLLDGFCDYAQNDGFGWYNEVGRYSRPPRHSRESGNPFVEKVLLDRRFLEFNY